MGQRDARETLKPNLSGNSAKRRVRRVLLPTPDGPEMTDEEKEEEAEKLFVLFDRLERNGAIQPSQNPVRRAMHQQQQQQG